MSLPALRALRGPFADAKVTLLAKPWVAALYESERSVDRIVALESRWKTALGLRAERFDLGVLLPNSFESAAQIFLAGAKRRVGYARDGRSFLLTDAVPLPKEGEIPRHERFYYPEMLRRAGLIASLPDTPEIRFDRCDEARLRGSRLFAARGISGPAIGVNPGAAFGTAKRWLPERFAEAAARLSRRMGASVAVFGSGGDRPLCEQVAAACGGQSFAGQTTLREFIDMTAACSLFLTNDSGAMHIAAALGIPSVTVFGPTDETGTGPCGANARLVRETVDCAPCKLRECPIDHRCMTRVSVEKVVDAALELHIM
ncbi:MAG: lipopolysaccharide heptosyltransferase II [Acidobacteriota bacterium]|nr:lipopolysaccharide heptosyltransferase II [Acidobacteriota bacterium]